MLPRRFQPRLTLGYHLNLAALAADVSEQPPSAARDLVGRAIGVAEGRRLQLLDAGVPSSALQPTVAYVASLRLLRDLITQGWTMRRDAEGILLAPPTATLGAGDDPSIAKGALRESFAFARRAHLESASTARFVRDMERRGVDRLFADGAELAERLSRAAAGEIPLEETVAPVLELVNPKARDDETGLRLQDVWRYARLHWSIPYQSTPGRNLFYLVRDDAGPGRPLVGIAALGNAVLGLTQRDEALGLTPESLRRRLEGAPPAERTRIAAHLVAVLERARSEVLADDLPVAEDEGCPVAAALRAVEQEASRSRRRALLAAGDDRTDDYELIRGAHKAADGDADWDAIARTALYRRKRAGSLAEILESSWQLAKWLRDDSADGLLRMLADASGRRAIDHILRRVRQRAITENVMEITTCGALPPYGDVLGGKAVAMLLASPQVRDDFAERYAGRPSLIASGLAGRPVRREARLALLTTSSLYSIGSSQYNRVRVPADPFGGSGRVQYDRLGVTESFGTVHFGPDTAASLVELARMSHDNRRIVNNLFGEGMSPKLRSIRTGLEALGLDADVFLRHHSPRLLYGVRLAENTDDVLLGLDDGPKYVLPSVVGGGADKVAGAWRERWLKPRLTRPEILERVAAAPPALLSRDLPSASTGSPPRPAPTSTAGGGAGGSATEFIEQLYRSTNSYADRLTPEELEWIDVDLGVGDHLLAAAREGRQVIVTGNPGDGKTHLIERLRSELEAAGALVLADANELEDSAILDAWQACHDQGRAFILAINEWPLFSLASAADRGFAPLEEALRQVQEAVWHVTEPRPAEAGVAVVDLGLRNTLSSGIVTAVLDRLCHERFYSDVHADDPVLTNRDALLEPRVRGRLCALLATVAQRGHHAPMRHLVGFVAFLLTGGRPAIERLRHQGSDDFHYATLAFHGGVGPLFDAVANVFDPADATHPVHDLRLWQGTSDPGGWLDPHLAGAGLGNLPDDVQIPAYVALKRRYFFEHAEGGELLDLLPADERRFNELAETGASGGAPVVRDLLLALNRFFEPDSEDRDRLVLWQSHRFDVRAPDTFVALSSRPQGDFRVEAPKYAPWVDAWLDPSQRLTQAVALVADVGDQQAQLLVDRHLFLTLAEAHRGLGRAGWSRSSTRRVTRFVDHLDRATPPPRGVSDVRIRNVDTDLDSSIEVERGVWRYRL